MTMLLWLWKNRTLAGFIILTLTAAAGWGLAENRGERLKNAKDALAAQEIKTAACEKEREISYETSQKFQDRISGLDRQLRAMRVQYRTACIKIDTPGGLDATPTPGKLPGPNGLNAEALLEFAADCERERLKIIGLQDYYKKISDR